MGTFPTLPHTALDCIAQNHIASLFRTFALTATKPHNPRLSLYRDEDNDILIGQK